jgi:hypothetical protein
VKQSAKIFIVAFHLIFLSVMYWVWRDFPFDPLPIWRQHLNDVIACVHLLTGIGLLFRVRYAKYVAVVIYASLFATQVYRFVMLGFTGSFAESYGLSLFLQRMVMMILFCGPGILLFNREQRNAAAQVTAADSARGQRRL